MAKLSAQIFGKDSGLGDALNDISKAVKSAGKGVDDLGDKLVKSLTPSSKAASSALDDVDESTRDSIQSIAAAIQGTESLADEASQAGRSARGMASGVSSLDSELQKVAATSKLSASQIESLSDEEQQALIATQGLSGSVKSLSSSQTKAAATSRAAASGIDEMGDEAGQAAGQLVGAASASELLSLQSSALSVNFGAFTIALRNLTTQVPLLVATIGNLGSALTGVGAAVGGVGLGGLAVSIGGVLAKAREGGANLTDLESVMNSLDQTAEDLQESFIEALNPLIETQGAIELFDNTMEGLMQTINSTSEAISGAFEGSGAIESEDDVQSLSTTLSGIGSSFLDNIDEINAAFGRLVLRLGGDLQSALESVFEGLPGVLDRITVVTEQLATIVSESAGEFGQFIDNLSQLARVVAAGVLPVLNEFFGIIGKVADSFIVTDQEIANTTGQTENLAEAFAEARDELSGFRVETIASAAKSLALLLALNRLAGIFGAIVTPIAAAAASLTSFFLAAKGQGIFAGFLLTLNRLGGVITNNVGGIGQLSSAFSTLLPPLGESTSITGALIRRLYATSEAEDEATEETMGLAAAMRAADSSIDEVGDEARQAAVSFGALKASMSSLIPSFITTSALSSDLKNSFLGLGTAAGISKSFTLLTSRMVQLGSVFQPLGTALQAFQSSLIGTGSAIQAYNAFLSSLYSQTLSANFSIRSFGSAVRAIRFDLRSAGSSAAYTSSTFGLLDTVTNDLADRFDNAGSGIINFSSNLRQSSSLSKKFKTTLGAAQSTIQAFGGAAKSVTPNVRGMFSGITTGPFNNSVDQSKGIIEGVRASAAKTGNVLLSMTSPLTSLGGAFVSLGRNAVTSSSLISGLGKSLMGMGVNATAAGRAILTFKGSLRSGAAITTAFTSALASLRSGLSITAAFSGLSTVVGNLLVGNFVPLISAMGALNTGLVSTGISALFASSTFSSLTGALVTQGGVLGAIGGALATLKAQYVTTGSVVTAVSTALGVLTGAGASASASKILLAAATTLVNLSLGNLASIVGIVISLLGSLATIAGILAGVFLLVVAVVGTAAAALMALGSSGKSAQELIDGLVSTLREIGMAVMPLVVSAGNAMTDVFNSIMAVGSTLVGGLKEIGVALGLISEDTGSGGMMAMLNNVVSVIKPVIAAIGTLAQRIGEYLTGKITQATDAIVAFVEGNNIAGKIDALVSNFMSLAGPIKSFANTVITAIRPVFNNIISSAQQVTSAIFGIFSSGEGGGGLGGFVDTLFNIANILIDSVKVGFEILGAVISALAPVVSFVVDIITGALVGVIGIIGSVIDIFGAFISGIFGSSDDGGGIFETIGSFADTLISTINVLGSVFEGIIGIASAIFGPLLSGLASVGSFIVDLIIPYVNYLGDIIGFVFGTAAMIVGGFIDTIVGIFSGAFGFISKILNGNIIGAFMGLGNGIVEFFTGIFGFLKNRIVAFATIIYDLISSILTTIFDAFMNLPSALGGIFTDIATGLVAAIANALGMTEIGPIGPLEIAGKTIMEEKTFTLGGGGDGGGGGGAQSLLAPNESGEQSVEDSDMGRDALSSGVETGTNLGSELSQMIPGMPGGGGDVNVNEGDSTNIFNQTISAEPEDEVQIGRIAEDAMSEANSFKRRQEGSQ